MNGFNSLNGAINMVQNEGVISEDIAFQFLKWCD